MLSDIVNRIQYYAYTKEYYRRKKKDDPNSAKTYRFYFLRKRREHAVISKEYNKSYQSFIAVYNDLNLNYYNRLLTIAQRANADISPYTTTKAIIDYILKYYSKAETETMSYKDIIKIVLPRINSDKPFLSFVAKFINSIVSERDQAIQEVTYLLLYQPLQRGTRIVVILDCRPPREQAIAIEFDEEQDSSKGKTVLEKYRERVDYYEEVTFFKYITEYNI